MKPIYWAILGVVVLSLAVYVGWDYLWLPPGPAGFAELALSASDMKERDRATVGLISMSFQDREEALPHLRRVAKESNDPEILAIAMRGLLSLNDRESLPIYFANMNHSDASVRGAAYDCVLEAYEGNLPDNIKYNLADPPEKRANAVRQLQKAFAKPVTPLPPPSK